MGLGGWQKWGGGIKSWWPGCDATTGMAQGSSHAPCGDTVPLSTMVGGSQPSTGEVPGWSLATAMVELQP